MGFWYTCYAPCPKKEISREPVVAGDEVPVENTKNGVTGSLLLSLKLGVPSTQYILIDLRLLPPRNPWKR